MFLKLNLVLGHNFIYYTIVIFISDTYWMSLHLFGRFLFQNFMQCWINTYILKHIYRDALLLVYIQQKYLDAFHITNTYCYSFESNHIFDRSHINLSTNSTKFHFWLPFLMVFVMVSKTIFIFSILPI